MEISGILCNSDFTWNQILSFLEFKVAILAISDALQTNFKASETVKNGSFGVSKFTKIVFT